MSVKLGKYIFRRIRGRIVPIRASLEMAAPEVSAAAEKVAARGYRHTAKGLDKLGKGVDFDAFRIHGARELVLKLPASNPGRIIKSKKLIEAIPNINDKVARSQAIGENLNNFGIPTVETFSVRIARKLKALVQPFVRMGTVPTTRNPSGMSTMDAARNMEIARREANKLSFKTGLRLDAHAGNVTHGGRLVDTALGSPLPTYKTITQSVPQRMMGSKSIVEYSDPTMAKELLDGGWIGRAPKYFKNADFITERAAVEGSSAKIMRAFNSMKKRGYRLAPTAKDKSALEIISPAERIARAEAKGVRFVKQNGKITVKRGK